MTTTRRPGNRCATTTIRTARAALVDALARDAMALVAALDGRELGPELDQAAQLLATVVGQDLDRDTDGVFRIARRVAKDRVISTVDPRGPARAQDLGARVRRLQGPPGRRPGQRDHHRHRRSPPPTAVTPTRPKSCWPRTLPDTGARRRSRRPRTTGRAPTRAADDRVRWCRQRGERTGRCSGGCGHRKRCRATVEPSTAMPAYGAGQAAGQAGKCGRADHDQGAAAARAGRAVRQGPLRPSTWPRRHRYLPRAGECGDPAGQERRRCRRVRRPPAPACPLAAQCTTSPAGRTITISAYEPQLARARAAQADPAWQRRLQRHPTEGRTQDRRT